MMASLISEAFTILLWGSVVASVLALCGLSLKSSRTHYFAGLAAAYVAYLVAVFVGLILGRVQIDLPLLAASSIDPLIEEPIRTAALFAFLARTRAPSLWLAFAGGYGLLESTLKFADGTMLIIQENDLMRFAAILSVPVVPLALHTFLGAVACRMRATLNASPLAVLLVCLALHWTHNYSALALARPEDWTFVVVEVWARILLLALGTYAVVR